MQFSGKMKTKIVRKGPVFKDFEVSKPRREMFDAHNEQIIKNDKKVTGVFFGDSITELWNIDAYFKAEGLLINRGISGDTMEYMIKRYDADVFQLKPEVVIFLGGTNDIAKNILLGKNYTNIINIVKKLCNEITILFNETPLKKIFWCSILPTHSSYSYHKEKKKIISEVNFYIKELSKKYGYVYVDYFSEMIDKKGNLKLEYSTDGLHPNFNGYQKMAEILGKSFKNYFSEISLNIGG